MATQTPNHAATKGIQPFLQKLYKIVEDPDCNHQIHWSPDGESFIVHETNQLPREVFGKWFKHKNYASFVRQLNNYGFDKICHLQQGTLNSSGTDDYEHWTHSHFRRDQPDLLRDFPRKEKKGSRRQGIVPVDNKSLPQTISLEVVGLKSRVSELEADKQALREELGNVQGTLRQHQKLLLRLLVSFGLVPMAGQHQWTRGNDRRLMIQGVEEKEGAAVPAPPCVSPPTFPGICVEAPPSPPGPVEVLDQWTSSLGFPAEDSKTTFLNSSGSGNSNLALEDFPGDVVGLFPPDLPHIISPTNTDLFDFDNSADFSPENLSGYNPNYGMGENDLRSFADMAPSFVGSSSGPVTASGMQTTSGMSRAPLATGDPTHLTAGIIREKRKASAMDESCGTDPQCTSRVPSPSLFPYDNHLRVELVCPPPLFRLNDDHTAIDITTTLSPSPKRAKIIPAHLNGE